MHDLLIYSVDDDKDERFFIKEAFSGIIGDKQLRFFVNGIELVNALSEEGCPVPDFILMDLNMPLMNGSEALAWLKKSPVWKTVPVVIFSTSSYERDVANCMAAGAYKYICKPSSMMDYPVILENLVKEMAEKKMKD